MKARFDNTGDLLLPGQFVNVKLTLQTLSNVITIPAAAVNVGPNGPFAYVVGADQTVSMQAIKVGPTEGTTTVITTGLQAGETVVIDGQMTLSAGSLVKVAAPAPAPSPAPTTPTQTPSAQTPAAPTTPTQTPSAQTPAAATPAAATPAAATPAAQTPAAQAPAAATPAAATPAAQTPAAATPAPQRSATQ
jgi:multidrug efflux system membrane fusion protein